MTKKNVEDTDAQPTGESVEQTLAVVSHILMDSKFAAEVRKDNGWRSDICDERTAVLFLASRYQWSVGILALQTATLERSVWDLSRRIVDLEERLFVPTD